MSVTKPKIQLFFNSSLKTVGSYLQATKFYLATHKTHETPAITRKTDIPICAK